MTRRIHRTAVKTYTQRIQTALQFVFDEAGAQLDANEVLISRHTLGNEIGYRLRGSL